MKSTGGGAVFGKPTARRSSISGGENLATLVKQGSENDVTKEKEKEKDVHHVKTTKAEAKLKLIQMEIAEKEACSLIRTLCADAAALLPASEQPIEITDLLSGVLLLGNLAKRIGYENQQLTKKVALVSHEKDVAVSEKTALIGQLEQVIMKLQAENLRLSDQIAENNLKNNQKAAILARDLFNNRELIENLKGEIGKLQAKLQYQERRMMDVPRLEESFMRQARGMIRQQEMANTMSKIEWKKIEEEAKLCQFWKGKAKAMEETIEQQKAEIEHLTSTARSNFAKFQQATQVLNNMKSSGKSYSGALSKQLTASGLAKQKQPQQQLARPASAPSLRRGSNAVKTLPQGESSDTGDGSQENDDSRPLRKAAPMASTGGDDKLRAELVRLREALEEKSAQVLRLSQQLSRARAYPLMAARTPRRGEAVGGGHSRGGWVRDDDHESHDAHGRSRSNSTEGARGDHDMDVHTKKHGLLDVLDEDLELTAEEEAEEQRLEEERIERALTIQRDFNDRTQRRRANNPPHIAAIRNSRSFFKEA